MTTKADCDHTNLATLFCPHCGESADRSSLNGLLAHVTKYVVSANRHLVRTQGYRTKEQGDEYNYNDCERYVTLKARVRRWASWRDQLKTLIDAQAKADVPDSKP